MSAKNFIYRIIISVMILILTPALIVLIVDPIQLYHNQITLKKVKYYKEQRHQNLGLINKYLKRGDGQYTVILGTSMSENFVPSKFMKLLHNKHVLKLTMSGGRPLEQYTLLKKALETGKVKRVIWDIHWYFLLKKISQKDKNHDFPYKLYSDNIFQQAYYYLFNEDYVKDSIKVFTGKVNWGKWTENLDKLNYTMDDWTRSGKFKKNSDVKHLLTLNKDIQKIKNDIPSFDIIKKKYAKSLYYPDIDKYVLPLIKQYKDVEFDLFFPPYSTYFYAKSKVDDSIRYLYARKYLVEKVQHLKNVKLFGFDNRYDIVNNIYYYKDYGHYRSVVNDFIMYSLLNDKHVLNNKNIDYYIENMIHNINKYHKVYYKNEATKNLKLVKILNLNDLLYKTNAKIELNKNKIILTANHVKKFAYFSFKIHKIKDIDLVSLKAKYSKNNVKMFSISLKNGKEYAHFFITPYTNNSDIILTKENISKQSKMFKFGTITEMVIRVYPKNSDTIKSVKFESIEFYTKEM